MTVVNDEHQFLGVHVLGEMYGIDFKYLDDVELLSDALKFGIEASGATLCNIQTKKFEPYGVTILALLSESHTSIHTYPDQGSLFFDAFTCGTRCKPDEIAKALAGVLKPKSQDLKIVYRGKINELKEDDPLVSSKVIDPLAQNESSHIIQ